MQQKLEFGSILDFIINDKEMFQNIGTNNIAQVRD